MVRPFRGLGMAGGHERLLQQLLKMRLPDIDDVVDVGSAAERRMVVFAVSGAGGPERAVRPICKHAVVKVAAEQTELPELIGDVLADICHDAVGSHDDFLALACFLLLIVVASVCKRSLFEALGSSPSASGPWALGPWAFASLFANRHDPAPGQATLGLQIHRAACLQHVERLRPEFQSQDVALPRKQVVVHVHPAHRLQVAAHDPVGDQGADIGRFVPAVFDVVQRLRAMGQPRLVFLVSTR